MNTNFKSGFTGKPVTAEQQHFLLMEKSKTAGKTLGITNLPTLGENENLESYIKSIRGAYSGLLAQEQNRIPSNQSDVAEIESKSSEQKLSRVTEQLNDAKNKLRRQHLELSELDDDDARYKSTWLIWVGAILIALLESLFSYKAFSMLDLGNNLTLAILLVCLTVAFIMMPKALRWWFEEYTPESKFKWVLNLIPVLAIGTGFYVLGLLRAKFLSSQGAFTLDDPNSSPASFVVSPWYFMGINTFLLLISYFLAYQFPSNAQNKNRAALEKKEAHIAKIERDIERYESELSAMPERETRSLIHASHSNAGRRDIYIKVNNFFKESVGAFIEANISYRSDGQRPRCFEENITDLENNFA
jgi:hypothetical protein